MTPGKGKQLSGQLRAALSGFLHLLKIGDVQPALRGVLHHRKLGVSDDSEILGLLNFFKCYRAYVRAKINLLCLDDPQISSLEKSRDLITAYTYFHLTHSYTQIMPFPTMALVGGLAGTGRTTLSAELARLWGMKHTSSDVTRKQLAGVPSTEDRNESCGQGLYSEALSEATCSAMLRETVESLGLGGVRL